MESLKLSTFTCNLLAVSRILLRSVESRQLLLFTFTEYNAGRVEIVGYRDKDERLAMHEAYVGQEVRSNNYEHLYGKQFMFVLSGYQSISQSLTSSASPKLPNVKA